MSTEIRRQARARRAGIGLGADAPTPAEQVLAACGSATGYDRRFLPPGDALLAGAQAVLDVESKLILQDESRPPAMQRFDAAHEFAHVWLHGGTCRCAADDLDPAGAAEESHGARARVDGYSPQQRREQEANVFAAEMLLPGPLARRLFLDERLSSEAVAARLGLPASVTQAQIADAVLLPPPPAPGCDADTPPTPATQAVDLDPSQRAAAEHTAGPLLLGAGPGTGKTKTLVGRCLHLTARCGVPAERILALTFSRKAAGEMRERLAAAGIGTLDAGPWVGTFHGFGLDVLRRFGDRIGLDGPPKLLDTSDAVTLLENHLAELGLDVLDNLYNPAVHLGGILGQIKRAKDELCPPARYADLCRAMGERAMSDSAALEGRIARGEKVLVKDKDEVARVVEQAAKAREIARCYAVYERLLSEGGFLDYGDLIGRTVRLLEEHADVRAQIQAEYPHVLADEYQDVNRASARLIRLLAGDAAQGLWVVGDHRQAIYQFQGASPANVAAFERDYPGGRRLELGVNYRSRAPIVDCFAAAGDASWYAHRGTDESAAHPAVTHAVAADDLGQAGGIAEAIENFHALGYDYRSQAILCRSHAQAKSLASELAARDVPALYLGALLERPEIKDLLGLLSLLAHRDGTALLRVAALPEYAVPRPDSLAVLERMRREDMGLSSILGDGALCPGLQKLGAHLAALETMADDPAALLRHYLFDLSQYLRPPTVPADAFGSTLRGLAIHQFLGMAGAFDRRLVAPRTQAGPPSRVRDFLGHLRRMDAAGESPRGSLPAEAEALDAVRLMTAHAAKGLEFPVVFLPNLGRGQFPSKGRHDGLPTPPGLVDTALDAPGGAMDEEQCLFFVALSRARDLLVLSHAQTNAKGTKIEPSPLLALVQPHLDAQDIGVTEWAAGRAPAPPTDGAAPEPPAALPEYTLSALGTYQTCPRQYFYKHVLNLPGAWSGGGYPQSHACVRQVLAWAEDARARGETPAEAETEARLESLWAASGPVGHLHEEKYKESARAMLRTSAQIGGETEERTDAQTLRATLPSCHIRVRPDALCRDRADGTLIAARHLTGKPGKADHTDPRLALYRLAARQTHPDTLIRVEMRYLADGAVVPVEEAKTNQQKKWEADRVAKYDGAARGIAQGRFAAEPENGDECGKCAYALICPL